jgi:hypothetical protein
MNVKCWKTADYSVLANGGQAETVQIFGVNPRFGMSDIGIV